MRLTNCTINRPFTRHHTVHAVTKRPRLISFIVSGRLSVLEISATSVPPDQWSVSWLLLLYVSFTRKLQRILTISVVIISSLLSASSVEKCKPNSCPEDQICIENWNNFECRCKRGFQLEVLNLTCIDVDECELAQV